MMGDGGEAGQGLPMGVAVGLDEGGSWARFWAIHSRTASAQTGPYSLPSGGPACPAGKGRGPVMPLHQRSQGVLPERAPPGSVRPICTEPSPRQVVP